MNTITTQLRPPYGHGQFETVLPPSDWIVARLGDCGEVIMGQSPPGVSYNRSGVGSPLINGPTEFTELHPVKVQWTTQPARFCRPGDLLICVRGSSTGRTNYADEIYAIGRGVAAIRAKADNDTQYLSYQVISGVSDILTAATGSTFPSVDGASFRKIRVSLPPPAEQRAIAEALSDVDGLLGALEELIAKKRAIKQAAMQQLLTGKTRLPGFSGAWKTKRIGETFTYLPTTNNPRADLHEYGQIEYIHYGDVHAHTQPVLNCAYYDLPRIDKIRVANAAHLQDGDLVMVDASEDLVGIGKSIEVQGIAEKTIVAGLHTILCRGNPDCWAMGFKAYLQFIPAFKLALIRGATGISVYAISKKQLADIELALPSPLEQKAIVSILSDMDDELSTLKRRRDKARAIKQGMMQQLLTGRIRLVKPETSTEESVAASPFGKKHNWQFNEAVVISVLAKHFGNELYPLGRMRYTKLSYLLHRREEGHAEGYLKKAAGPYNPQTRYGGPEKIALQKDYVRQHTSGKGQGFIASTHVDEAERYFDRWYGSEVLQWLEQFRYETNNDLELLTTVDMAAEELCEAGEEVSVESVKEVIRSHPEWDPKLDRPIFSDANLARAIESCQKLFDY